ncbi:MAG: Fic family protein [Rhizomicrobium sp.]
MELGKRIEFSQPVSVFHEKRLPETGIPVGYAALIDAFRLDVPLPRTLTAIGQRHKVVEQDGWQFRTPRHAPDPDLQGHLVFALKYEGVDLAVLNRLFAAVGPKPIEALVRATPTGSYARRIWFLFEWLTGKKLELADAEKGNYAPVIDPEQQWAIKGELSARQRVSNNLPGTPAFCPLVFRTKVLEDFTAMDLARRAQAVVAEVPRNLLARTAAFLLLKDSKSSFAIEGEHPPRDRIQRWGRAIGEAGRRPIDLDDLLRLQRIVIGDDRFVKLGLRKEGGFVGEHDRETGAPLPDHISARPEDLGSLMDGVIAFDRRGALGLDAVIAATILAFGFVYIHPFQDGNGRVHRYLIHHVLAQRGYNPAGVVFPVSAAILDRIDAYRTVLEDYSQRLLPLIHWEPTNDQNVRVLNDTADYYRYFDATPHAEFLYACVKQTIEEDLPRETDFLRRYDQFRDRIQTIADMPDATIDLLFRFLKQNDGTLSKRGRENEFSRMTDSEVTLAQNAYATAFGGAGIRSVAIV